MLNLAPKCASWRQRSEFYFQDYIKSWLKVLVSQGSSAQPPLPPDFGLKGSNSKDGVCNRVQDQRNSKTERSYWSRAKFWIQGVYTKGRTPLAAGTSNGGHPLDAEGAVQPHHWQTTWRESCMAWGGEVGKFQGAMPTTDLSQQTSSC